MIVGLIIGDGFIGLSGKRSKNARLEFEQSMKHFSYFWSVFNTLSHYCSSFPSLRIRKVFGKEWYSLQFFTRSLPCFTLLHTLFYNNGIKVIPEIIFDLLTPLALAHWICCDGSKQGTGLLLCTNAFTIPEVVQLINILIVKYLLESTLRFKNNQPMIAN